MSDSLRARHPRSSETIVGDACHYILDGASMAFAVTRGSAHTLISANESFLSLVAADREAVLGRPIHRALNAATGLRNLLDRALHQRGPVRDAVVGGWICSVWRLPPDDERPDGLVLELRELRAPGPEAALHRDVAEHLLLSALRENSAAAELARERAHFLGETGRPLARSIDEAAIHLSLAELYLPRVGSWCILDLIDVEGSLCRHAIIHPDPRKRPYAVELQQSWSPQPGDAFGLGAILDTNEPVAITEDVAAAVASAAHDDHNRQMLERLDIGALLTVPMSSHGRLLGAITFVGEGRGSSFTPEDVALARELAIRGALALDNARLYGAADLLRKTAQRASEMKSEFLGHVSHELRTPLNVIGGYIDLLDLEIHGPLNETQHSDLDRIRGSQQQLLVTIDDILDFMRAESGKLSYRIVDLPAHTALTDAVTAVEPAMVQKQLVQRGVTCDSTIVMRADPDRTHQILVSLLTNAVKFTSPGGRITLDCQAIDDTVRISVSVSDTGTGIPPDRLEAIFEPFVQARSSSTEGQGGVGLGLAISRELARAMNGDVTVHSTPGSGSRFTLSLPRSRRDRPATRGADGC
jgi:signal transduction histidine kinase